MKKFILFVSISFIFTGVFGTGVSAANPGLTAKAESDVKTEETLTVSVYIKNNPGFDGIMIAADYDREVFSLKSTKNGDVFGTIITKSQNTDVVPYKIMWITGDVNFEKVKDNGLVVTYNFKVNQNAPLGKTSLRFYIDDYSNGSSEKYTFDEAKISVNIKKGADYHKTSSTISSGSALKPSSEPQRGQSASGGENALTSYSASVVLPSSSSSVNQSSKFVSSATSFETASEREEDINSSSVGSKNNEWLFPAVLVASGVLILVVVAAFVLMKKRTDRKNEQRK